MATAPRKSAAVAEEAFPAAELTKEFEAVASAPVAEMPENMRKVVEKTVADAREAYVKAKTAAEEVTSALETGFATAKSGMLEINTKALSAMRANAEAGFDFVGTLIAAKSVSDYVSLQTEFTRKQVEALTSQVKELGALAQKVANDSTAPFKEQVAKTFKIAV